MDSAWLSAVSTEPGPPAPAGPDALHHHNYISHLSIKAECKSAEGLPLLSACNISGRNCFFPGHRKFLFFC